jgi:hypothetical protein
LTEAEIQAKAQLLADERGLAKARIAYQIARINHLNKKNSDGFMQLLIRTAPTCPGCLS